MITSMAWTVAEVGDEQRVMLKGCITEESDFKPLLELKVDRLVLDLGAVEQINSCGVREWINFVRELAARGRVMDMLHCPPAIVRQLNMISNFKGEGAVRSVLAPYYCNECEHELSKVIDLEDASALADLEETLACPECGGEMEFDDLPDSYLEFRNA